MTDIEEGSSFTVLFEDGTSDDVSGSEFTVGVVVCDERSEKH